MPILHQDKTIMNLYLLSLLAHIMGLTLAAGTTVIGFLVNRRFWKLYGTDKTKALILMELGKPFRRVIGIGIGLLLLSGFYIVYLSKGVFAGQLWLRIKLVLVLVVIVNSFVAKALEKRVKATVAAERSTGGLQGKVTAFYLVQLFLFLAIFVLGIFKFT
jgi:uncharacterized membrane protein SirB2